MTGVKSDSISEKTTERSVLRFFSPLIATMYTKDDWGNLEEYGEEVFPAELCSYETEILEQVAKDSQAMVDGLNASGKMPWNRLQRSAFRKKETEDWRSTWIFQN